MSKIVLLAFLSVKKTLCFDTNLSFANIAVSYIPTVGGTPFNMYHCVLLQKIPINNILQNMNTR